MESFDNNDELLKKDFNIQTKKLYQTKKFWIIISIVILCIIVAIVLSVVLTRNNQKNEKKEEEKEKGKKEEKGKEEEEKEKEEEEKGKEEEEKGKEEEEKGKEEEEKEKEEEEKEKEEEEKGKEEEEKEKEEEEIIPHIFQIDFNYEIIPSETGSQNILVNWTSNENVNITINVKGVENEIIRTYSICNSEVGEKLVKVYFGMPKIYIKYESSNETKEINKEFQIPAKEVAFAPLHGTMAPLIFSLEIFNIKTNLSCPIYMLLQRGKAWNWNKLPEGVFLLDIFDEKDPIYQGNVDNMKFITFLEKLKKWMAQMIQVNNSVIFNLFINDYHNYIIPICLYANNIPPNNYKIYMLSDGVASYIRFNALFDNKDTYVENYNNMKKKYSEFKDFVWSQKKYDINSHDSRNLDLWALTYYPYVIFK